MSVGPKHLDGGAELYLPRPSGVQSYLPLYDPFPHLLFLGLMERAGDLPLGWGRRNVAGCQLFSLNISGGKS